MKLKVIRVHTFMMGNVENNLETEFNRFAKFGDQENRISPGFEIEIYRTHLEIEDTKNDNGSPYKIYRLFVFYEPKAC